MHRLVVEIGSGRHAAEPRCVAEVQVYRSSIFISARILRYSFSGQRGVGSRYRDVEECVEARMVRFLLGVNVLYHPQGYP
jgi:hypothetical protein